MNCSIRRRAASLLLGISALLWTRAADALDCVYDEQNVCIKLGTSKSVLFGRGVSFHDCSQVSYQPPPRTHIGPAPAGASCGPSQILIASAPPPPLAVTIQAISGADDNVCSGDDVTLTTSAFGGDPNATMTYRWNINGAPVPGATGPIFHLPTAGVSGARQVTVTATSAGQSATSGSVLVNILPLLPPTLQFAVNPNRFDSGAPPLALNARAVALNRCNGNLTVTYHGAGVTGSSFDPGAVDGFDQADRVHLQTRSVPLTATVTDAHNQTSSADALVTVALKPLAQHSDILFPDGSARLSIAAERYLLEKLSLQLLADSQSTLLLVGHRDASETPRSGTDLASNRVNNVAALLSAGTKICGSLDLERIKVSNAGDGQLTPPPPFAGATIGNPSGSGRVATDAQYRRVEVWFIPSGADAPNIPGLSAADGAAIKKLACPM